LTTSKKKSAKKGTPDHTQMAFEGIRRMLFRNEIMPGQKISYRILAERLGMSLTPVIQALKRLEFQGLVRHEPNRGYFTEPISLQEIQEIYETREVVEISLLPAVIRRLDEEGIDKLLKITQKDNTGSQPDNLNERLIRDREFHLCLASLSSRAIQLQILHNLYDLLYLKYRGSLLFVASKEIVGSHHKNIFDAVVSRDLKRAQDAMRTHFNSIKSRALAALSQMIAERELPGF
jgi:DNA-binding GntR family transcriptional regulator